MVVGKRASGRNDLAPSHFGFKKLKRMIKNLNFEIFDEKRNEVTQIFKKKTLLVIIQRSTDTLKGLNKGKSAASFCHQAASWISDRFYNFYIVKNHKIAKNLTTTKAREKNKHIFGIIRIF
jgi:hypothetical protein